MSFTVREVSAMLGLTASQIRSYATKGFLQPERGSRGELRFGFQDLVILRTAGELSSAQVPQRKVRRVLERLREQLPVGRSLTAVRIAADGDRVVVRDGSAVWNPESGQSIFDFAVADVARQAAPFVTRAAEEARDRDLDVDDLYQLACDVEITDIEQACDRLIVLGKGHTLLDLSRVEGVSERLVTVLVTTGLSGLFGVRWIEAVGLWVLAVATVITVGQRMIEVRRQVGAAG